MWCHLCSQDYLNFEEFRLHILKMHRNASTLSDENSDNESEHNTKTLEKEDENVALNSSDENCLNSDCIVTENNPINHLDVGETSVINSSLKKSRKRYNKENKSLTNASNKLSKKSKMSSVLKKRVVKPKLKVKFNKKRLTNRRMPAVSYQEDIPELSDSNEMALSEDFLNRDIEISSQVQSSNFINPQSTPQLSLINPQSNLINSQPSIINSQSNLINLQSSLINTQSANTFPQPVSNNPVFIVNPYSGQNVNNYVVGNQPAQQPVCIFNTTASKPSSSDATKCFDFNSQNILKWLTRHKELCKSMEYPLPTSLYKRIKIVHRGIFDHYFASSIREETAAVMKVYEDLDCMILKHINSVHNSLDVL